MNSENYPEKNYSLTKPAYFKFDCESEKTDFVIKLTDPAKIQEARNILSGKKKTGRSVRGTIVKSRALYNPSWNFHLDPDSISFFPFAISHLISRTCTTYEAALVLVSPMSSR